MRHEKGAEQRVDSCISQCLNGGRARGVSGQLVCVYVYVCVCGGGVHLKNSKAVRSVCMCV